jgi:hypothetical protein
MLRRMTSRARMICEVALVVGVLVAGAAGCASTGAASTVSPAASAPPATGVISSPASPQVAELAPPSVPPAIMVPAMAQVAARFHAVGAQVYACGPGPAGGAPAYAWTLKKPDATLSGDDGRAAGTHGAGPSWTSTDGSSVVGKKLAQADAPAGDAIPWLLVGAVSTTGAGVFSGVTYIQRIATSGGKAPASGCSAETVNAETRVPYAADYYFFRGGKP